MQHHPGPSEIFLQLQYILLCHVLGNGYLNGSTFHRVGNGDASYARLDANIGRLTPHLIDLSEPMFHNIIVFNVVKLSFCENLSMPMVLSNFLSGGRVQ